MSTPPPRNLYNVSGMTFPVAQERTRTNPFARRKNYSTPNKNLKKTNFYVKRVHSRKNRKSKKNRKTRRN